MRTVVRILSSPAARPPLTSFFPSHPPRQNRAKRQLEEQMRSYDQTLKSLQAAEDKVPDLTECSAFLFKMSRLPRLYEPERRLGGMS